MLKDKAINSTTDIANQSKELQQRKPYRPYLEDYYSAITGKKEILNTRKLDSLVEYIFKCAQTCDGMLSVHEYLKEPEAPFRITVRTYESWLNKYPQLEEANNELKEAIGNKLRSKVLKYEIAPVLIHKDLNLYCDRYKKHFEWEQSLKNKDTSTGPTHLTVITSPVPNSPIVPALEVKKDE